MRNSVRVADRAFPAWLQFARDKFGPGLPEPDARSRLLAKVVTIPMVVAIIVVSLFSVWAIDSLRWWIAVPSCLAVLAGGFLIAIWFAGRSLRKNVPTPHEGTNPPFEAGDNVGAKTP